MISFSFARSSSFSRGAFCLSFLPSSKPSLFPSFSPLFFFFSFLLQTCLLPSRGPGRSCLLKRSRRETPPSSNPASHPARLSGLQSRLLIQVGGAARLCLDLHPKNSTFFFFFLQELKASLFFAQDRLLECLRLPDHFFGGEIFLGDCNSKRKVWGLVQGKGVDRLAPSPWGLCGGAFLQGSLNFIQQV